MELAKERISTWWVRAREFGLLIRTGTCGWTKRVELDVNDTVERNVDSSSAGELSGRFSFFIATKSVSVHSTRAAPNQSPSVQSQHAGLLLSILVGVVEVNSVDFSVVWSHIVRRDPFKLTTV